MRLHAARPDGADHDAGALDLVGPSCTLPSICEYDHACRRPLRVGETFTSNECGSSTTPFAAQIVGFGGEGDAVHPAAKAMQLDDELHLGGRNRLAERRRTGTRESAAARRSRRSSSRPGGLVRQEARAVRTARVLERPGGSRLDAGWSDPRHSTSASRGRRRHSPTMAPVCPCAWCIYISSRSPAVDTRRAAVRSAAPRLRSPCGSRQGLEVLASRPTSVRWASSTSMRPNRPSRYPSCTASNTASAGQHRVRSVVTSSRALASADTRQPARGRRGPAPRAAAWFARRLRSPRHGCRLGCDRTTAAVCWRRRRTRCCRST